MTRSRLPRYTHITLIKGKRYVYLDKPGQRRVRLPDPLVNFSAFMLAHERALAELDAAPRQAVRTPKPGSIDDLISRYYASREYLSLAPATKQTYRALMERFRKEDGDMPFALLKERHVRKMLDERAARPSAANHWLRMVRLLMRFAQSRGLLAADPTVGIRKMKTKPGGFPVWSEPQIAQFEAHHPVGSRARLALALGLFTGQRRGDVVRLGSQHRGPKGLTITQSKTGHLLTIPVHAELAAMLDALPADAPTFLLTAHGRPYTPAGFGNAFRDWCNDAGLPPGIAFHGLRKAAAVRLAEAGATTLEIAAVTGHASLKEVERYTAGADQVRLAQQGFDKVEAAKIKTRRTGP